MTEKLSVMARRLSPPECEPLFLMLEQLERKIDKLESQVKQLTDENKKLRYFELRPNMNLDLLPLIERLQDALDRLATAQDIQKWVNHYLDGTSKGTLGDVIESTNLLWRIHDELEKALGGSST